MMNYENKKIILSIANDLLLSFGKSRLLTLKNLKKELNFSNECNIIFSSYLTALINTLIGIAGDDEERNNIIKYFTQTFLEAIKEAIPGNHVFEIKNMH